MAKSLTARFGLQRWSADTDTQERAEFDAGNAKIDDLAAMDMQDTLVNRPAAVAANRGLYYFVTGDATAENNDRIWRSTGAAWIEVLTGPAASAAYVSKASVKLWLPSRHFFPRLGAPSEGGVGARWNVWLMDAAVAEGVAAQFHVPADWATMHVDLHWTNPGGNAGDVTINANLGNYANGESTAKAVAGGLTTVAAPGNGGLKVTRILTGAAVTPANMHTLLLDRNGDAAADTLANDAGYIGVLLTKAS